MKNYLNFETDIKNLESELDKLKDPYNQEGLSEVDTSKISIIQEEINEKLKISIPILILGKQYRWLDMKIDLRLSFL